MRLRGALHLAVGRSAASLLLFARNVTLARLLPVEDYGIASTFVAAIALPQMAGDLSLDRLLVQHRDGEKPAFAAAIQGLWLLRGLVFAALLAAAAPWVAALFGQEEIVWAYRLCALVPLVLGLRHLDTIRLQREMRFGRGVAAELSGAGASFLLAAPVALALGDWRAMPALLVVDCAVLVVASHLLAVRRFRLRWDGGLAREALAFGAPLVASGIIAFLTMQGERIIVANQFDARTLGLFSAALTLAMAPVLLASGLAASLFLPLLARQRDDAAAFETAAARALQAVLAVAFAALAGFALLGPTLLAAIFGAAYAEAGSYVALVGAALAVRLGRVGPNTVATAAAATSNHLASNLVRLAGILLALAAVLAGGGIALMLLAGLAGEAAAAAWARRLIGRRPGVPRALRESRAAFAILLAGAGVAAAQGLGLVSVPWTAAGLAALAVPMALSCRGAVAWGAGVLSRALAARDAGGSGPGRGER